MFAYTFNIDAGCYYSNGSVTIDSSPVPVTVTSYPGVGVNASTPAFTPVSVDSSRIGFDYRVSFGIDEIITTLSRPPPGPTPVNGYLSEMVYASTDYLNDLISSVTGTDGTHTTLGVELSSVLAIVTSTPIGVDD